jgi:glycosyltransferase involved in cell wall biosynthesis
MTHHGPTYQSEKWNFLAKSILRVGEWLGVRFANEIIVVSPVIAEMIENRYGLKTVTIPNGVKIQKLVEDSSLLTRFKLQPRKYVLLVSRFVPEKRHLDLIDAFETAEVEGFKLALVGGSHHPDSYEKALRKRAAQNPNIVLTGFLSGDELKAVYQHASVFVLPSSLEGLPIALLEALSYGLPCLASNIPANRSIGLDDDVYFELGDTDALAKKISASLRRISDDSEREATRRWVAERYDWHHIAQQTVEVYWRAVM